MSQIHSDIGRYGITPEWLLDSGVSDRGIRLFSTIAAKYADRDTATGFPSRKTLASDLGCSTDSIDRALRELEKVGAIVTEHRFEGKEPQTSLYLVVYARPGSRSVTQRGVGTDAAQNQNQLEPEGLPPEDSYVETPESSGPLAPKKKKETKITEITDAFRDQMAQRFGPAFGDTVQERIDEALAHKAAKNYTDMEKYVRGWLRRDAEKMPGTGGKANGKPEPNPTSDYDKETAERAERLQRLADSGSGRCIPPGSWPPEFWPGKLQGAPMPEMPG